MKKSFEDEHFDHCDLAFCCSSNIKLAIILELYQKDACLAAAEPDRVMGKAAYPPHRAALGVHTARSPEHIIVHVVYDSWDQKRARNGTDHADETMNE